MLEWLHLNIIRLQTLVDNLLESASLEAGRFQISPRRIWLDELIAEAVHLMRPLLQKYDQALSVEIPDEIPAVYADPKRIVQVLVNLLSNANKHSAAAETVTLSAQAVGEMVEIAVADRGPGIPSEHQDDIFYRFAHFSLVDDRKQSGVGLGLWVVKAIVVEHGGRVGVSNRDGGGARFWFTLPIAQEGERR